MGYEGAVNRSGVIAATVVILVGSIFMAWADEAADGECLDTVSGFAVGGMDSVQQALQDFVPSDHDLFERLDDILLATKDLSSPFTDRKYLPPGWDFASRFYLSVPSRRAYILGWTARRIGRACPGPGRTNAQQRFLRYVCEELADDAPEISERDRIGLLFGAVSACDRVVPSFPSNVLLQAILPSKAAIRDRESTLTIAWAVSVIARMNPHEEDTVLAAAAPVLTAEEMHIVGVMLDEMPYGPKLSEAEFYALRTSPACELVDILTCGDDLREECAKNILGEERLGDIDVIRAFVAFAETREMPLHAWSFLLRFIDSPVLENDSQDNKTLISRFLNQIELDMRSVGRMSDLRLEEQLEQMLLGSQAPFRRRDPECGPRHGAIHEEKRILGLLFECVTCPSAVAQMNAADALDRIVSKRPDLAEAIFRGLKEAREKRTEFPYQPFSDDPGWQNDLECNPEPEVLYRLEAAIRSAESAMERYKERDEPEAP